MHPLERNEMILQPEHLTEAKMEMTGYTFSIHIFIFMLYYVEKQKYELRNAH